MSLDSPPFGAVTYSLTGAPGNERQKEGEKDGDVDGS